MKKDFLTIKKSSFLALAKDTALIMDKILGNKKLLKLLYYTSDDILTNPEKYPDLTSSQIKEMFDTNQISNIPKIKVDKDKKTYLRIGYDSFTPNESNPYYRDHVVEIKIICHFDDWDLHNFELRPYRIAGEIDSMINNQHFTGIGILNFIMANQDVYDDEYAGITLTYLVVNGNEDKVNPLK